MDRKDTVVKKGVLLKDEQEKMQKKTFTKWMNSYLCQKKPPIIIKDLMKDLSDGLLLLDLLEILTKTTLKKEKPKNMQKIHCLSNIRTALEFMENDKKIKLVNINPSDVVDGKPAIVLGLVWTAILHFQIEEQEEFLLQALGMANDPNAKVKGQAKKGLMAWTNNALSDKYGLNIKDFGESWCDGRAFNALVHNIDPTLVNMEEIEKGTNKERLENAFNIAENELGIPKLLDSEDVDVEKPDEKSIMTYVAQFLKSYPEGKKPENISEEITAEINGGLMSMVQPPNELDKVKDFNDKVDKNFENLNSKNNYDIFADLMSQRDDMKLLLDKMSTDNYLDLDANDVRQVIGDFDKTEMKLNEWQWDLDKVLPGILGSEIGSWLQDAEESLMEPFPNVHDKTFNDKVLQKLKEHESIFNKKNDVLAKFREVLQNPPANISPKQLEAMKTRMENVCKAEGPVREKLNVFGIQANLKNKAQKWAVDLNSWDSPIQSKQDLLDKIEQFNISMENGTSMDKFTSQLDELVKRKVKFCKENPVLDEDLLNFINKAINECEEENDILPEKFESTLMKLENLSSEWDEISDGEQKIETFSRRLSKALQLDDFQQQRSLVDQLPEVLDLLNDVKYKIQNDLTPHCSEKLLYTMKENLNELEINLKELGAQVVDKVEKQKQKIEQQQQAARDTLIDEIVSCGQANVDSIKQWMNDLDQCMETPINGSSADLQYVLSKLKDLDKESPKIQKLIDQGYQKVDDLENENSPEKAQELKESLNEFQKKFKRYTEKEIPKNLQNLKTFIDTLNIVENDINDLEKTMKEGEFIKNHLDDLEFSNGTDDIIFKEQEFLEKENEISKSLIKDKDLLKNIKKLVESTDLKIDLKPLEKRIFDSENVLQDLLTNAKENLTANNQCNEACTSADQSLECLLDQIEKNSSINNDEEGQKTKLKNIENFEEEIEEVEKQINAAVALRNNLLPNLNKSNLDKIDNSISKIKQKTVSIKENLQKTKVNLSNNLNDWQDFKQTKDLMTKCFDDIIDDLKESHQKRKGVHGENLTDKADLLEENKERLENLIKQEDKLKDLNKKALKLGLEKPIDEVKNLKDQILKQKANLEEEIQQNEKDLENHQQFNNDIQSLHDWLAQTELLTNQIQNLPNTKEGLIEKQKLLEDLNSLKSTGDKKLKELKNLQKVVLNETAPDEKENINIQLNAEIEKFNEVFVNLDKQGGINETIEKIEDLGEKSDQISENINEINKRLEKCLNLPSNTLNEKEKLTKELNNTIRLVDQQLAQINDLKSQCKHLENCEAVEELLNNLESLEEQCNIRKAKIEEKMNETESDIKKQAALENNLKILADLMNETETEMKISVSKQTGASAVEENLEKLKGLKSKLESEKNILENIEEQKDDFNVPKHCLMACESSKKKYLDLKDEIHQLEENLNLMKNNWSEFDSAKSKIEESLETIGNDIENMHVTHNGIHGGDCDDKVSLLNEKKNELDDLIRQEEETNDLFSKAKKLGSNAPMIEIQNLKERILKQKENLKKEIKQNEKDLENHQQFNNDIQSLHDWLAQTELLTNQIQNLPNTKEGLIEKQKLLEDLNSLKSTGDKKLKELKNLQKVVLNETAPDEKENINIQLNAEIEKFNEVFVNLDKQGGINETIEKIEDLGEKSDQISENINEINKRLEKCLNLPSNTLNEKEKLNKELNNTIRLVDQQLAQINDLKSQCESLENCEAVEELLDKLESLEEQCNANKSEIEDKIVENNINIKMQAAFEEKLDEFANLMNEAEIEITSLPKENSEIAIEESLQKLENIKSKHLPGKNTLEEILKSQTELRIPQEYSETCEKYEEKYCNLENGIKDLTNALEQKKSNWSRYNLIKSDIEKSLETLKDDINVSHEMRKGIHGKDSKDKETIFHDNKKRLQDLNDKEKVINELIEMAKLLGSEKPVNEVLQLKKTFLEDKNDLENEIKINEKDLKNHRQYENDLDLFHDWILEAESLADKISGTPSTKAGLIEKQNLLNKLKNLKPVGEKMLKEIKNLQKVVLNETAPDEKENINIQLNAEIEKFNEVFVNLDIQDGINETIEKIEDLGEQSDQVSEDISEINKKLEKCLNLPSNTLNEKEKLAKELNSTNRLLDQQLAKINDLKSQCRSLEHSAALEDLLNKLESLEEHCFEIKTKIDERVKEVDSDIKFQSALEEKLNDLSEIMNEVEIEFDYSKPKESSEAAINESLSQLQKLKAQHEPGKNILKTMIKLRNEFNAPEQCVTACNDLEQKYFDIEDDIKNLQKELEMKTTVWQKFNALKADLDKTCNTAILEIGNEHKKRSGIHGGDCEDKFNLLEDKKKILSNMTNKDPQVDGLIEVSGKLGFDKALFDAQNIKRKYLKLIDDLQQEISQNEIDLDNHKKLDQSLFGFEDWMKNTEKIVKQIANLPNDKNGLLEKQNRLEEMKTLKSNGNEMIKNIKHLQNVVINETAGNFKTTLNEKVKNKIENFERVFGDLDQETDNIKETIDKLKVIDEKSNEMERNIREIENTINKCSIVTSESVGDKEKLGKIYRSLEHDIEQHLIDLDSLKQQCNCLNETTANSAMINKLNKMTDECKSMKAEISQLFSKIVSDLKNLKTFQDKMNEFNESMDRIETEIEKCSPNGCNEAAIKDNIKKLKKFRSLHENSKDVLTDLLRIGFELSGLSQISEASDQAEQKYSDVEDEITKLESKLEMQKNDWSNFNSDKNDLEKWLNEITKKVENLEQISDGIHGGRLSEKEKVLDSHQKLLQEALNREADIKLFLDRSTPLFSAVNQDSPKRVTNTLCKKYEKLLETLTNRIQKNEEDINLHENYAKQIDNFKEENNIIIKRMNEEISLLPNTKEGLKRKVDLLGNLKDLYNQRKMILINLENLKNAVIDHSSSNYYSNLEQEWDQIIDSFEKSFNPSIENQSKLLLAVQQIEKTESICQDLQHQLENLERRLQEAVDQHISSLNDIDMKLETLKELRYELRDLQTPINDVQRKHCQNPSDVELIQERIEQIAKQHKVLNESISQNINETENHHKQLCNLTTSLNNFKTWLDYSSSQIEEKGKPGNLEINNLKKNLTSLKQLADSISCQCDDQFSKIREHMLKIHKFSSEKLKDDLQNELNIMNGNVNSLKDKIQRTTEHEINRINEVEKIDILKNEIKENFLNVESQININFKNFDLNEKQNYITQLRNVQNLMKENEKKIEFLETSIQNIIKHSHGKMLDINANKIINKRNSIKIQLNELINKLTQMSDEQMQFTNLLNDTKICIENQHNEINIEISFDNNIDQDKNNLNIVNEYLNINSKLSENKIEILRQKFKTVSRYVNEQENLKLEAEMDKLEKKFHETIELSKDNQSALLLNINNVTEADLFYERTIKWLNSKVSELEQFNVKPETLREKENRLRILNKIKFETEENTSMIKRQMGNLPVLLTVQNKNVDNKINTLKIQLKEIFERVSEEFNIHEEFSENFHSLINNMESCKYQLIQCVESIEFDKENKIIKKNSEEIFTENISNNNKQLNKVNELYQTVKYQTSPGGIAILDTEMQLAQTLSKDIDELFLKLKTKEQKFENLQNKFESLINSIENSLMENEDEMKKLSELKRDLKQKASTKQHLVENILPEIHGTQSLIDELKEVCYEYLSEIIDRNKSRRANDIFYRFSELSRLAESSIKKVQKACEDHELFDKFYKEAVEYFNEINDEIEFVSNLLDVETNTFHELTKLTAKLSSYETQRTEFFQSMHNVESQGQITMELSNKEGRDLVRRQIKEINEHCNKLVNKINSTKIKLDRNIDNYNATKEKLDKINEFTNEINDRLNIIKSEVRDFNEKNQSIIWLANCKDECDSNLKNLKLIKSSSVFPDLNKGIETIELKLEKLNKKIKDLTSNLKTELKRINEFENEKLTINKWLESLEKQYEILITSFSISDNLDLKINLIKNFETTSIDQVKMSKFEEIQNQLQIQKTIVTNLMYMNQEFEVKNQIKKVNLFHEMIKRSIAIFEETSTKINENKTIINKIEKWIINAKSILQTKQNSEHNLKELKINVENLFEEFSKLNGEIDIEKFVITSVLSSENVEPFFNILSNNLSNINQLKSEMEIISKDIERRLKQIQIEEEIQNKFLENSERFYLFANEINVNIDEFDLQSINNFNQIDTINNKIIEIQKLFENIKETSVKQINQTKDLQIENDVKLARKKLSELNEKYENLFQVVQEKVKQVDAFSKLETDLENWLKYADNYMERYSENKPYSTHLQCETNLENMKEFFHEFEDKEYLLDKLKQMHCANNFPYIEKIEILTESFKKLKTEIENQINHLNKKTSGVLEMAESMESFNQYLRQDYLEYEKLEEIFNKCKNQFNQTAMNKLRLCLNDNAFSIRQETLWNLLQNVRKFSKLVERSRIDIAGNLLDQKETAENELETLKANWSKLSKRINELNNLKMDLDKALEHFNIWLNNSCKWFVNITETRKKVFESNETLQMKNNLQALKDDITEHKVDLSRLQTFVDSLMKICNDETFQKTLDEITKEYNVLFNKCQNECDKCDHLIKLMTKYEISRADVLHWIEASTQTLLKCSDYTLKQSQMKSKLLMIDNLEKELENYGQSKFVEAIQDGEELLGELAGMPMQIVQQQMADLKSDWMEISRQLNQLSSNLRNTTSRSEAFKEMSNRLSNWLDDIEHTGLMDLSHIEHQCEIPFESGNSSSKHDRAKTLLTELNRHKQDFLQLANLATELANPSFDIENSQIQNRYNRLSNNLKDKIEKLNKQQADYDQVKQDIEEMEKWVFQTSIRIINENAEQGKTTNNTIQEIETLIKHSNEIIANILSQEPEIVKIGQAVDSLININNNKNSDKEKELQDDLSKLIENFNNLKSSSIHKRDHLKDSVKKWDTYQDFLQSTKLFLDNELPNWWRERNQDQMKSGYSNFNNEHILKEILDMDNKLNGLKTTMELEAKACDGILPTIAITASRSQTPNFKSNRSLYSPSSNWSTNKSDVTPNDELIPNILSKSIYEDLDENIKKVSNLKKEIIEKITDWNNFNREKTSFKNWMDNEMLKFSSVLYTEPGISNFASLQKSKLKEIQEEMNYKKQALLNLNTRFKELTSNVSGAADLVLKNLNQDFDETEKKISKLLNREDKGVEADFTDEESNMDIIQERKVPKLNLKNLESPQLFRYESPENLNRFTQTNISKAETDYKFKKTNFSSQTPGTKTTQTNFNDMSNFGTQTNDKYQKKRERKLESELQILNSLKNMNSEFERSKPFPEYNNISSVPMSAKPRSSALESVRRNIYPSYSQTRQTTCSPSMQRIENGYKSRRPLSPSTHSQNLLNKPLSQNSNLNLTKSSGDNLDDLIPTKNKWVDLEINAQLINSSLKSYPFDVPSREFHIDYNTKFEGFPVSLRKKSPQRRSSGSPKRNRSKSARNSRITDSINRITEDANELRNLSQKLRSVK